MKKHRLESKLTTNCDLNASFKNCIVIHERRSHACNLFFSTGTCVYRRRHLMNITKKLNVINGIEYYLYSTKNVYIYTIFLTMKNVL